MFLLRKIKFVFSDVSPNFDFFLNFCHDNCLRDGNVGLSVGPPQTK